LNFSYWILIFLEFSNVDEKTIHGLNSEPGLGPDLLDPSIRKSAAARAMQTFGVETFWLLTRAQDFNQQAVVFLLIRRLFIVGFKISEGGMSSASSPYRRSWFLLICTTFSTKNRKKLLYLGHVYKQFIRRYI